MSLEYITQSDFSGGINQTYDASLLASNELLDAEDCLVDQKGIVQRRGPVLYHGLSVNHNRTDGIYAGFSLPVIIAAGRHGYHTSDRGVFAISTKRSGVLDLQQLYFFPYDTNGSPMSPFMIFEQFTATTTASTRRTGMASICPAITKANDNSGVSNARYNRTIAACESFTVAVMVSKGSDPSSGATSTNTTNSYFSDANGHGWYFRITFIATEHGSDTDRVDTPPSSASSIRPKITQDRSFRCCSTVGGYTFLAGDDRMTQHFYWSASEDSLTWDPNNFEYAPDSTNSPIRALHPLGESLCIMKERAIFMLRVTPSPGGWSLSQRSASIGTCDQRSIGEWHDSLIFADTRGIYRFDGFDVVDISKNIAPLYQPLFNDSGNPYSTDWHVNGFVQNDYYILTITDYSGSFKQGFICHLPTQAWTRIKNMRITANCFAPASNSQIVGFVYPTTYPGSDSSRARMVKLSTMFDGCTGTDFTQDGPSMSLTTAFISNADKFRSKVWRRLEVTQASSGAAGVLNALYATGTDSSSMSFTSLGNLPKGGDTKSRFRLGKRSRAIAIKVTENNVGGYLDTARVSGLRIGFKPMRVSRDEGN